VEVLPLMLGERKAGEVTVEQSGLYLRLCARAVLPEGIWCVWLAGEQGEFRLGVPEPQGGECVIRRRVSGRTAAAAGKLLRGEVRRISRGSSDWELIPCPATLFQTDWLRRRLESCGEARVRRRAGQFLLAVPCRADAPFLLEPLFCFARICGIDGRDFAVFAFDNAERPLFFESETKKDAQTAQKN